MSSVEQAPNAITLAYKTMGDHSFLLDLHLPNHDKLPQGGIPAVVYFHGGGLVAGTRRSWFPTWLYDRCIASNCALICPEYRLLPHSNGHDIVEDICDAFEFIRTRMNTTLSEMNLSFAINGDLLAAAGSSAGGICAYLAGLHVEPRPKAILVVYAMGGNWMTPWYMEPKQSVFFRGRALLDPVEYAEFLYPSFNRQEIITNSQILYHPPGSATPGLAGNPRQMLGPLYLQIGTFLDYYTGQHDPSLTQLLKANGNKEISKEHVALFPQFLIDSKFPPTYFLHGTADTVVPVEETYNLKSVLEKAGVRNEAQIVEGEEHLFDYADGADEMFLSLFDSAWAFVLNAMLG